MFSPRTILFPTDGSACAERARTHALALAERFGADLHVLTVDPIPSYTDFPTRAEQTPTLEEVARDLHDACRSVSLGRPRLVNATSRAYDVDRALLDYAERVNAGLIVMGTHGRRGIQRLLLGSTAEFVLRRAVCPVLLVPSEEAAAFGRGRVLVADDFSALSDRAVGMAREIAEEAAVGLDILHIVEHVEVPSAYGILSAPPVDYAAMADRAMKTLCAREEKADPEIPARLFVALGDPARDVLVHAEKHGVGLIVMGSHGRKGFDRVLLGSVSEAVVRHARCPVLVVKAPEDRGESLSVAVEVDAVDAST